jgi:hypothetical protein
VSNLQFLISAPDRVAVELYFSKQTRTVALINLHEANAVEMDALVHFTWVARANGPDPALETTKRLNFRDYLAEFI